MGLTFELDESVVSRAEGVGPSLAARADVDAPPDVSDHDLEIACCTPGLGPEWARYFATRYSYTSDELGRVALIPAYQYILDKCQAFEDGVDHHGEKTRQMTITWTTASNHLCRTMFGTNCAGFITSRKEKVVDDGGSRSTTFSLIGKMRFIYEHLPEWMRLARPVTFSHLRVECTVTGSYVVGEGATGEGGRSGTFGRATVDEAAFMPGVGWFRALRSACPQGLGMDSTPNGKANVFARLKYPEPDAMPHGFRMLRYHWTRHPQRRLGLYKHGGKLVDGVLVGAQDRSPWYDAATKGLTKDEIAREFDISYEHSASGLCWPEYNEDKHLSWDVVYDPTLPLYGGMDFGMGAATTVVFFQVHGKEMWIIGDYEVWNADVEDHAPALKARLEALTGGRVKPSEFVIFGDPAGRAREMTNKNSTVMRAYQAHGFSNLVAAPDRTKKDRVRLVRRKFAQDHVQIHHSCLAIKNRLPDYRYRTDDMGYVLADVIQENSSTHIADAIQYGATGVFDLDDWNTVPHGARPAAKQEPAIPIGLEAPRRVEHVRPNPLRTIMSRKKVF